MLPPQRSERIQALHQFIVKHFPQARLSSKYKIPTYELDNGWVAVASQKNYVSLYTCAREHIHPKIKRGTGSLNIRDSDDIAGADPPSLLCSAFSKGH
ncbi:DUF1801 domain-containing protein [Microbulbifer marinus]|uniref:DUF1801 domain-containing protein n=1 Tax=Microbulbifer marinus TaxID=658218 RepID=UPI00147C956B|nr:DUF1801 domain-containing protein [Microbulbifer marinus]